jgi:hypothetical protein
METKPFYVNLWGSHPDDDNDDCWTGEEFDTLEEAQAAFARPETIECDYFQNTMHDRSTVFIEVGRHVGKNGVETLDVRRLRPDSPKRKDNDDDWRREIANEAGMLHGVEAFNEVMGWD